MNMKMNQAQNQFIALTMPQPELTQAASIANSVKTTARRNIFLKWLRKTHSWIGLWGAVLGLLFGVTGFLLNHRSILKIPAAQTQETTVQLPLPTPMPKDAKAMALWLQDELVSDREASRVKSDASRTVAWGDKTVKQPAHWSVNFTSPSLNLQADYWVGNTFVTLKRSENNIFATLNNLHKGSGLGMGWILLVDTLAGSIIFLSLTGVILWSQLNRRRLIGAAIVTTSLTMTAILSLQAM
jgi:hypothetical protein